MRYISETRSTASPDCHTEILENNLFKTAYKYYPKKFQNKTNGITQRRWLMLCNREFSALIDKSIGTDWRADISKLSALNGHITDITDEFIKVKTEKKAQLFDYIKSARRNRDSEEFYCIFAGKALARI